MAAEDTTKLWRDYRRSKDPKVRDRLILTYAPLVKYVAGRLGSGLPAHVDDDDLVGTAAVLVVLDATGRVIGKRPTTVGGEE